MRGRRGGGGVGGDDIYHLINHQSHRRQNSNHQTTSKNTIHSLQHASLCRCVVKMHLNGPERLKIESLGFGEARKDILQT